MRPFLKSKTEKKKQKTKKQLNHDWEWQKGIRTNKNRFLSIVEVNSMETERERETRLLQSWQWSKKKYVGPFSTGLHLIMIQTNRNKALSPWSDTWRQSTVNQPCGLGSSRCSGTSTEGDLWLHACSGRSSPPRCQDMTCGLARQGGGVVVTLFPGLWTWWRREFMMLLEHYWVFCPLLSSLQDCFWFSKDWGKIYVANSW